ncbi:hypothetical protein TNCV_3008371 [Trichonephila clavipes]|nr:hypothetical protein TNCV_3008371 [Trichonephila clavipes]
MYIAIRSNKRAIGDGARNLKPWSGHGSLVVKVTDSWPACQEFEPSTVENSPCRVVRCTLNMSSDEVSSSFLDPGLKLRGLSPEARKKLNSGTLIFTHSLNHGQTTRATPEIVSASTNFHTTIFERTT